MSREYTRDEVQEMFLNHVRESVRYWNEVNAENQLRRLEGLAFTILATLDGCSTDVPGFIVAPAPHESDKEYAKENNENWFPENHEIEEKISSDIAGSLHERFYQAKKNEQK